VKTYDIYYDPEDGSFKIGDVWTFDLSEGDVEAPLIESRYLAGLTITLPITCRTNEDFYNLYPELLL
jgi:hypothetical protein